MKSMTTTELDEVIHLLESYKGYELTNILYNEKSLQLSLSGPDNYHWLTFSLKPQTFFFLSGSKTRLIKGLKKPLVLFCQSHLKGKKLFSCKRLVEEGRVVQLSFSEDENFFFKVMLFSGGQNIFVQAGDKSMSAFKPREGATKPQAGEFKEITSSRSPQDFIDYWQQQAKISKEPNKGNKDQDKNKALKKKKKGLEKMQESLKELKDKPWQALGEWLKSQTDLSEVPEQWRKWVDSSQSLAWNIENCFAQSKKGKQKIEGTKKRISLLEDEISRLEKGQLLEKPKTQQSLMQTSEAKGRTRQLQDGSHFYIGKSGKDNLALLRRAKPWFLWLHIRDYPGAHGILERPKKAGELQPKLLQEAAAELLKQTVKGKPEGVYEVLIAECRYVRPIKGAKPGQVTHSHEKVLRITL